MSLEESGGPSAFVIKTHALEEVDRAKVKEALCYLAPEQTGSVENMTEDHRTDLYSLGIFFWTLLVGRGASPFEGGPLQLLHAIAQKRPMPVHEIRRDVPQVLAVIIEMVRSALLPEFSTLTLIQLLSKNPEARYQSALGVRNDLMECQKRLLEAISLASENALEVGIQLRCVKDLLNFPSSFRTFRSAHKTSSS